MGVPKPGTRVSSSGLHHPEGGGGVGGIAPPLPPLALCLLSNTPPPPTQPMRESPSHLRHGDQTAASVTQWLNSQLYSILTYINENVKTDRQFTYWKLFEYVGHNLGM